MSYDNRIVTVGGLPVLHVSNDGVKFVRWPAEANLRNYCRREGIPCLLVVEGGAQPPVCTEIGEDWVRAPISRRDLDSRVEALLHRIDRGLVPVLDSTGTLYFNNNSLIMSETQADLMELFVVRFGAVVYRRELEERLSARVSSPTRNSLDLHIMRLRRRLASIELGIRTAWGRGYLLWATSPDCAG
jgi:hypothetical protein